MEQHEPEGGKAVPSVEYKLFVACYPYQPTATPIIISTHFTLKFKDLVAKQHPTSIHTHIHIHTFSRWSRIHPMLPLAPTVIPFITFLFVKFKDLVAKQHSTNMHAYTSMLVHACMYVGLRV